MAARKSVKSTEEVEPKVRMYTIVLKEKSKDGEWLSLDVDDIMPLPMFGENYPMIMGVIDDRAYMIPFEGLNWFEQNFGVKEHAQQARNMVKEKLAKTQMTKGDVAFL